MKPLRLVVAINPTASFGKGSHVGPAVVQTLRAIGHDVTSLQEPDFEQLAASGRKAVATKPDAFIVVGGDGMVNLGTNLVVNTRVPLGVVPSGTGNDMARGLGIPYDNTEAAIGMLSELLQGPPRTIDAGRVDYIDDETGGASTRWFAGMVSAGFDSVVNERANRMRRPKGASRYTIALGLELLRLKPTSYRLVLDGQPLETRAMLVTVGNNVSLGGGMKVTPNAKVDDGLLDVLVVQPLSRLEFLRIFPRVFKGTHLSDSRVAIHRVKSIRIESDIAVVYSDGERIGPAPVEVTIAPRALRIFAPT
ncbi:diacylglycerol kinase family protein [Salinibacterium sp.]|uniref:diacylglycerol/lipid kinase family protein n=1 Tax=Salinibacterium sp. TaxID=1915057 RepID=UPI00286B168C|nr:diacylglycerol kinase family protein [Salinibacterium sp.]